MELQNKRVVPSPSFAGLHAVSLISSLTKRANRNKDTSHEILLRMELWRLGLRYRKHAKYLPGKPDIFFPIVKVAVFCDGDFWHGRNWRTLRLKLDQGTNANYWSEKIASNIKRDRRNTALLEKAGWHVIRLWEKDIKRDPMAAAKLIRRVVDNRHEKLAGKIGPNRKGRMKR